jgi:asparagine synthetase B (glutamine-hydrolysing)
LTAHENIDAVSELFSLGFILGDKTLLVDRKIPELAINYRVGKSTASWKNVFESLECSVIERCQEARDPCMLLSGGMDSRIIAGIIAENKIDIPFFTIDILPKESGVSKEISEALKLQHFIVESGNNQELLDVDLLFEIAAHTLGTLSLPYFIWRSFALRKLSREKVVKTFITGLYGSELLAESLTYKSMGIRDFCTNLFESRFRAQTLERKYHHLALTNLIKYCPGFDIRSAYYETYIKSRARTETLSIDGNQVISPFLDSEVLTSIFSLPPDMRMNKRIHHLILKHKFPKLARIKDVTGIPENRMYAWARKKIGKIMNLRRAGVIDFDSMFRQELSLKKYIRGGVPSISNENICEKLIDDFYNQNMPISKFISYFISNYFVRAQRGFKD